MANNPYDTLDEVPVVEEKKVQPEPTSVETVKAWTNTRSGNHTSYS